MTGSSFSSTVGARRAGLALSGPEELAGLNVFQDGALGHTSARLDGAAHDSGE